jgi:uroporphyrinogen decarboxylase
MVPIFEFGMEIPVLEKILGRKLPSFRDSVQNPRVKAEDLVRAYETLGLDMITVTDDSFFSQLAKPTWKDGRTFVNEFGQVWRLDEVRNTELYLGGSIQFSEDMEPPKLDASAPGRIEFAREVVRVADKRGMAVAANIHGGFSSGYLSCGMENFLVGIIRHPLLVQRLMSAFTGFWAELSKRLIDVGIDVIGVGDDVADKHGLFLSPNDWRRLVKPELKRIVDEVKKRGGLVFFHSDGNINSVLDDIVDIGFDGLHSMEPLAGMDIGSIKKKYADKLCLLGNVDCSHTLCFATLPEVAQETRDVIKEASPLGGHILCSSNSLHSAVKLENFLTMVATGRKFGKYPLGGLK